MRVTQFDENGPRFAVVEGSVPSPGEFARIRQERLGVQVLGMPAKLTDLDFLEPIFDCVTELRVNDYQCKDARAVEKMSRLTKLGLGIDPRTNVDLSVVRSLKFFAGPWKHFESVIGCESLDELRMTTPDPQALEQLRSDLSTLKIFMSRKLTTIPMIAASTGLRELSIYRTPNLDLTNLPFYRRLASIELTACTTNTGVEGLLESKELKKLTLENCTHIENWELLDALSGVRVRIIGKNPFSKAFQESVEPSTLWTFPPGRAHVLQ
jgi:hypothetical protein